MAPAENAFHFGPNFGHTFIDLAESTSDQSRRDQNLQRARDVIESIDRRLPKLQIDTEQRTAIEEARIELVRRLEGFG